MRVKIYTSGCAVRIHSANPRYSGLTGHIVKLQFYADSSNAHYEATVRVRRNGDRRLVKKEFILSKLEIL